MCGIAGVVSPRRCPDVSICIDMLSQIQHRGPDEGYYYSDSNVVMGAMRLSIINISHGRQPAFSSDGNLVAVFNGEIYNHQEVKVCLQKRGYTIRDGSDVEIIPHAYHCWGMDFPKHLNGQFAIALWDKTRSELVLARDRAGQKPLYYSKGDNGDFVFGSEIKALFAHKDMKRSFDYTCLGHIFTFWTLVDTYTPFAGVRQIPAGAVVRFAQNGTVLAKNRYWDVPCSGGSHQFENDFEGCRDAFKSVLNEAVRIRLKADVDVGTYTSGGIDSSIINYIAYRELAHRNTETFCVNFDDSFYDESVYQRSLSGFLGLTQHEVTCTHEDVYRLFPRVVFLAETPLFRTAPIPMFLLSKRVKEVGLKVVLTGEGSDEVNWGYDIFREAKVRRFWAKKPDSKLRPMLFKKMYSYLPQFQNQRFFNLTVDFFRKGLTEVADPFYSHAVRIANSTATHQYFSEEMRKVVADCNPLDVLQSSLPDDYADRTLLEKCQYLEMKTLLAGYLLSSQGDRMQSAHGVEGRCPYLDPNVMDFAATIPEQFKLNGLKDKYLLRQAYNDSLPRTLVDRAKFAYRAPEMEAFKKDSEGYLAELLSEKAIDAVGLFDSQKVRTLVKKIKSDRFDRYPTRDNLAFVQILSTQMLHRDFIEKFSANKRLADNAFCKAVNFP